MKNTQWNDDYIFQAYELAYGGMDDKGIAGELNVTKKTFTSWLRNKPAFKRAILRGREQSPAHQLLETEGLTPRQVAFLKAFCEVGVVSHAAYDAFVTVNTVYEWKGRSEAFAAAYEKAKTIAADMLEGEAVRRAKDGVRRYKFFKGVPICVPCSKDHPEAILKTVETQPGEFRNEYVRPYYEHEYSDRLLELLLKAKRRNEFSDKQEVNINQNTSVIMLDLLEQVEGQAQEPEVVDAEFIVKKADKFLEHNGIDPNGEKPKRKTTRKKKAAKRN